MDFKTGAGYYVLKNIRTNQNSFLDIWILNDGRIENRQDRLRIKHWNNYSLQDSPTVPPIGEDFKTASAMLSPTRQLSGKSPTRGGQSKRQSQSPSRIDRQFARDRDAKRENEFEKKSKKLNTLANASNTFSQGLRFDPPKSRTKSPVKKTSNVAKKRIVPFKETVEGSIPNFKTSDDEYSFCLDKDCIKSYLNGVARVIEFGTFHKDRKGNFNPTIDSKQNYIISISEG